MKIAVFRALQLGDLLCAVPALRALHAEYPAARITLVGLPWAKEFARRFRPYVVDFLEFPCPPEDAGNSGLLTPFFEEAWRRRFDLAVQMHGSGEITNPLVARMGARRIAGYGIDASLEWRPREHEIGRWLRLAAHLGAPSRGRHLEFPLGEADWQEWRRLGLEPGAYAVVHPGSQLPSRRWPAQRFARVADALAREGLQVVLTGTAGEAALTREISARMVAEARDLAGLTTLGGVAALIARARLLVSNDTGVSHIAAAVRTQSVVVACGSDPLRWAPLDHERHRVLHHPVECRPCMHAVCPIGHPCALGVAAEQVIGECTRAVACAA
ncbi:MAG TPA: glycosyltransferase family 9 protein [Burkholderiales bacterium]|nr:glycosyltransferase family 9 protein [Burkholderiales bacterium]